MFPVVNGAEESKMGENHRNSSSSVANAHTVDEYFEGLKEKAASSENARDITQQCRKFVEQKAHEFAEHGQGYLLAESLINELSSAETQWGFESKLLFNKSVKSIEEILIQTVEEWRESEVKLHKDDAKSLGQIEALANAAKEFLEPTFK
jgi:hypothetical protein